ncbi:MAG: protein-methionine-sulfoxide reductase catalytic subunit MsrP [Rhodospirillales bacterium]|jgi:sulfoxide reductase catalytic subunit YedY|nr:protein-methionine-sulfoxide reductase catalytic subunit MsrP [Rhodospirillales bacterium]
MHIRITKASDIPSSEITPKAHYMSRRRFLGTAAAGAALAPLLAAAPAGANLRWENIVKGPFSTDEEPTPAEDVTSYNNFYEFGTGKGDPIRNSRFFRTKPWSVAVEGEIEKPGTYQFEDLVKPHQLEERVYRLRCVERWSMVVPWVGIPLAAMIKRFEPTSKAKYVAFETLHDPKRMPGQSYPVLDWPYVEGLRMDEAMNPLTLMVVGLYGEVLPNQNGAPLRLMVPWKYGFKSIKSIVAMRFVEKMPPTSWSESAPGEYGFYANVNPDVHHPRWSQARERRIGDFLKRDTLMFNGYGEEVAGLYAGMDLAKNY